MSRRWKRSKRLRTKCGIFLPENNGETGPAMRGAVAGAMAGLRLMSQADGAL
jgi:hypothetical protein